MWVVYAKFSGRGNAIASADVFGVNAGSNVHAAFENWAKGMGYNDFVGNVNRPAWANVADGTNLSYISAFADYNVAWAVANCIKETGCAIALARSEWAWL
jgi:hypothetical protein